MTAPAGLLLIWTDVTEDVEADFNAWYDRQHLAERVGVPGILNGKRYVAIEGAPKYFAWYETGTAAVLGSAAYGSRQANPTDWTQRVMPAFRNVVRVTAEQVAKAGSGLGAAALTLRVRPAAGREDDLQAVLAELTAEIAGRPGVVAVQSWRPSDADAAQGTTEAAMRAEHEEPPAWGLLIEATTPEAAAEAAEGLGTELMEAADADVDAGVYRLLLARGEIT